MTEFSQQIDAKTLLSKIKSSTIDQDLLKEAAEVSATLSKYGIKDWCIYGQPGPDGTCSTFHVNPNDVGDFVSDICKLKNSLINFDVFPLGIINPEIYEIKVRFGNSNRRL